MLAVLVPLAASAQGGASMLTVDRIFAGRDFQSAPLPSIHWLADGKSYLGTKSNAAGGSDFVRVDLATGQTTLLVDASAIVGAAGKRLDIENIDLSSDETKALLFHDSERVWRQNTRGVYHVLDIASRRIVPISTKPGLQMFAKFSPNGRQVAFVRGNNLWVSDLAGGERQLTTDGSETIINGTTDWVYEEEFGLSDAFRWSPDGRRLAFWRFDQSGVPSFPMVDETGLYPAVAPLRYPKAGQPNSTVRLGIISIASGATKWLQVATGPDVYIPRMNWAGNDSVVVMRMPRRQNRSELLMASAVSGITRAMVTDSDSAYVDVEDPVWIGDGRQFLWLSDRSGWRQLYLHDRSGKLVRQVTQTGSDVLGVVKVDEPRGTVYVQVAAPNATQRQVFRYSLNGGPGTRVTQGDGSHTLNVGPGGRYAIDTHSSFGIPSTMSLQEFPSMRRVRVIEDNAALKQRLSATGIRAGGFFRLPAADGTTMLDAYRLVPSTFDSTKKYPVLMYVYGGPASPQVNDSWGGTRYLWHQSLTQKGYVVVVVDNRGAAWRGRDFRKMTQNQLGKLESDDQIAAARWLGQRSWADSARIGIWGWSYGGYMTAMATMRGGNLFRMGMSVAPVTDWRLYDTIYTERFMWTPQDNGAGYTASAPLTHVNGLTAKFLLVHGLGDDNVHPQNSVQLMQKLQLARKPFSLMLYPNKTHSISGAGGTLHLYDTLTRFVLENL
ncbi:MAG: S9 family peptidase [Gemmatimonadaceae bacterium]